MAIGRLVCAGDESSRGIHGRFILNKSYKKYNAVCVGPDMMDHLTASPPHHLTNRALIEV